MTTLDFSKRIEEFRIVYTAEITKELDITVAAVNFIFLKENLSSIEFNSYALGVTKYSISEKKFYGNTWESETDAKAISSLNYHYTSIGLNGTANEETNQKIFNAVLSEINNDHLKEIIINAMNSEKDSGINIKEYFQIRL